MDFETKFLDIKKFLWIPFENKELEDILERKFSSESEKFTIINKISQFIHYFEIFKNIQPFMQMIHRCVVRALEFNFESLDDIDELLIKTILMHVIQEYIKYSNLSQRNQVLDLLTTSLERLNPQPLILNLGLLVKPLYQDEAYLNSLEKLKEIEVEYVHDKDIELEIKNEIHEWLNSVSLDLNNQEELLNQLENKFNELIKKHGISKDSHECNEIFQEIKEMCTMKLVLLSLEDSLENDSCDPISIK